jgi:hypothetical protein
MRGGWSLTESWGVWTDGSVAGLSLDVKPNRPLVLRAEVRPFLTKVHDRLCVRVAACGKEIAEWVFEEGLANTQWCTAPIPPRHGTERGQPLQIFFTIDAPRSPLSLGLSEDPRSLGLAFLKLSISAGN